MSWSRLAVRQTAESEFARFLAKLQITQSSILLGIKQKKTGTTKNENKVHHTNLSLIEGILYRKHQTEPNFETVYQMLVPWERVSNVLEQLHDSTSVGHFEIEKHTKGLVNGFLGSGA